MNPEHNTIGEYETTEDSSVIRYEDIVEVSDLMRETREDEELLSNVRIDYVPNRNYYIGALFDL